MSILKLKNKTTGEWEEIQAIKGEQGPQGVQGKKGEKGDKGDKGDTGEPGPQGPQGVQGEKGEKGDTGETGERGETGPANTLSIGTVTNGEEASAEITGEAPNQTLNLVLPQGIKGDTGDDGFSPTVTSSKSGKTTTLTITDVNGTSTATILDGEDGPTYTAGSGIDITNNVISNTQTSAQWGNITGTLSNQTDLQNALDSKADASNIPTKTSDLTNDSGFITSSSLPTKVSDLTNDSGFITNTVNDLVNYYKKTETFTKQEVNNLIGQIATLQFQVVSTLPQTGDSKYIYLIPSSNPKTQNVKDEYIWVNNSWEQIGSTQIDLTGYATESWVNTQISNFLTQTQIQALIDTALSEYTETDPTVPSHVKSITQTDITNWNNKVTSLSSSSSDDEYPSAKCVYDNLNEMQNILNDKLKAKNINLTINTDYVYSTDLDYICIKIGNVVFLSINTIAFKVGDIPNFGVLLSNLPKPSTPHIFYLASRYGGEQFRVSINPDGQLARHWAVDPEHGDSANKQYHGSIIYFTND